MKVPLLQGTFLLLFSLLLLLFLVFFFFFLSLMVITCAPAFSWAGRRLPFPPSSSWASLNFPRCTQLELVLTCYWINWILFMVMGSTAPDPLHLATPSMTYPPLPSLTLPFPPIHLVQTSFLLSILETPSALPCSLQCPLVVRRPPRTSLPYSPCTLF